MSLRLRTALRTAVARSAKHPADGSLFVPMRLLENEPAYRGAAADTRRQLLEPRRAVRARVGRARLERAGARGAPLPAHAWLALPRRRARRGVLALRPRVGLDRPRPGVRPERGAVPRGARRARPARAQPLRTSRSGDDARHVRRRRGCLAFADRAGVLSLDVPAAEQRRQRRLARDAAAPRRQRAARRSWPAARLRDAARLARARQAHRRQPAADRDSGRSRTRSSRTPIRSAPRSTSRGSRSIHSRCGSGCRAARTSRPSRSADGRCGRSTGPPARST